MVFHDHIAYSGDPDLMMDYPFGFLNQTNEILFERNYRAVAHDEQTIRSWSWSLPEFLRGLIVTRVMPLIYIFVILISVPLNGLAMVMFCRIREKKPAVIYMCNLACVDLLFTLLLPLKIHYQMNASNWVFGEAACRVLSASYYGNLYCSVLLMMCISVDRLLVVAYPVACQTWRTAGKATCVCVVVWLLTLGGIVPLLMMNQTTDYWGGISCSDIWADSSIKSYVLGFTVLLCICFVLPLVVIIVSYSIIIYVLCAKRVHSSSSTDKQRRAAIMVTAALTEFVVCFVPSNILLLYHHVCLLKGSNGWDTYPPYLFAVCLGSSSVFLDPLLYYYGSSQYRQQIRSVFYFVSARRRAQSEAHTISSHLSYTVNPDSNIELAQIRPTSGPHLANTVGCLENKQ